MFLETGSQVCYTSCKPFIIHNCVLLTPFHQTKMHLLTVHLFFYFFSIQFPCSVFGFLSHTYTTHYMQHTQHTKRLILFLIMPNIISYSTIASVSCTNIPTKGFKYVDREDLQVRDSERTRESEHKLGKTRCWRNVMKLFPKQSPTLGTF